MTTWWQEHDEFVRANRSGHDRTLASHLVALLDDVEARFVAAGGDAMRWDDPHVIPGEQYALRDRTEEEYGRATNPAKYAILDVRIDAWVGALTTPNAENDGRPLADVVVTEGLSENGTVFHWPLRTVHWPWCTRTLTPHTEASPLHLTTRQTRDDVAVYDVALSPAETDTVSTNPDRDVVSSKDASDDPTHAVVSVLLTPHCGCDACDSGSGEVLEELDRWILSIVDGSFEIIVKDDRRSTRTSFGGDSNLADAHTMGGTRTMTGRSWWPGKRSRPLAPPFSASARLQG